MTSLNNFIFILTLNVILSNAARILTVVPTPSLSHQVVFRPITQELARRGHEVTVITTDPAFPRGEAPANLTEIDLHDISYKNWRDAILSNAFTSGTKDDMFTQLNIILPLMSKIYEIQMQQPEVQKILSNGSFDLLILEAWVRPVFMLTHVFKNVPVIAVSSLGSKGCVYDLVGAPSRPALLYPTPLRQRLVNLTLWDKMTELYNQYTIEKIFMSHDLKDDIMVKTILGPDTPGLEELEKNVDMLFMNVHSIWEWNRPVPPNVVYMGGVHQKKSKDLPQELKEFLDSSKHGVIYISYGTNVSPSTLAPERIQTLVEVFSQLPYDVLWKWDSDELPGQSKNIRTSKWLPQSDLLKHPKIKLFITQGGLQSTDEAITAGVPLIGMPMLGDQWYNVEQYVHHKIGVRVDLDTLTEDVFKDAINTVINDGSFKKNIEKLRDVIHDQPETGLQRAVWWTEYVIRHGSARHLRAHVGNMTWTEYLDVELLAALASGFLSIAALFCIIVYLTVRLVKKYFFSVKLKRS